VGREFQQEAGGDGQVVMVTPILVGTDGVAKMSKSKGNYIGVTDPAGGNGGMFGKVMSLPDHLLENYYTLLTDLPEEEYKPVIASNPRDAKVALAKHLIGWLHDANQAAAAEAEFIKATHGGIPDDIPQMPIAAGTHKLPVLLTKAGITSSNSDAIRKLKGDRSSEGLHLRETDCAATGQPKIRSVNSGVNGDAISWMKH